MKAHKLTWEVNDVLFGLGVLNNCGLFQSRQSDFEIGSFQFLSCVYVRPASTLMCLLHISKYML